MLGEGSGQSLPLLPEVGERSGPLSTTRKAAGRGGLHRPYELAEVFYKHPVSCLGLTTESRGRHSSGGGVRRAPARRSASGRPSRDVREGAAAVVRDLGRDLDSTWMPFVPARGGEVAG